jgi:uncharacterized coiled-coil protein SlyX
MTEEELSRRITELEVKIAWLESLLESRRKHFTDYRGE